MKWTADEDATVRAMHATHTRVEIAAKLGRTEGMVRSRCWTLGLNTKSPRWTPKELSMLRDGYAKGVGHPLGLEKLAQEMGRTSDAICQKAADLGLTDPFRPKMEAEDRKGPRLPKFATKEALREHMSAVSKLRHRVQGHPRGMLGKRHTEEIKKVLSACSKKKWQDPSSYLNSEAYRQSISDRSVRLALAGWRPPTRHSRTASGTREDLGIYVRSSWEANYARFLNFLKRHGKISDWEYEPHSFHFEAIKRGTRTYTPDFKVTYPDGHHEWHEVKGWMDDKSRIRLERMAKYFPEEKIVIIDEKWFKSAAKNVAPMIPNWERGGKKRAA